MQGIADGVRWCCTAWWKSQCQCACCVLRMKAAEKSRDATQCSPPPETPWAHCMAGLEWIWGHWIFRNLWLLPKSLITPHSVMWHLKRGHCPQLMSRVTKDPHSHLNFHRVPGVMPQGIFSNSGGATCYLRRENEPLAIKGKNTFILNES